MLDEMSLSSFWEQSVVDVFGVLLLLVADAALRAQ